MPDVIALLQVLTTQRFHCSPIWSEPICAGWRPRRADGELPESRRRV